MKPTEEAAVWAEGGGKEETARSEGGNGRARGEKIRGLAEEINNELVTHVRWCTRRWKITYDTG